MAKAFGLPGSVRGCPPPDPTLPWQPDIIAFRRDLAVLVGGLAPDLLGRQRPSPAGAEDLIVAIQRSFDQFALGARWPDVAESPTFSADRLPGVVAEIVISRSVAETQRAVATATRFLLRSPMVMHGSDHGK